MLCVLLCFCRSSAHWVFLVVAGCLGPYLCAPVLALLVALMGRLSVLKCAFWGFLLSFALLHLFPPLRLFVTYFACILLVCVGGLPLFLLVCVPSGFSTCISARLCFPYRRASL